MRKIYLSLFIFIYVFAYSQAHETVYQSILIEIYKGVKNWNAYVKSNSGAHSIGLRNAKLDNRDLSRINLFHFRILYTSFKNCKMTNVNLEKAFLTNCDLEGTNLKEANMNGVQINHSNLRNTYFLNVILKNSFIWGEKIYKSNFNGSDLSSAYYSSSWATDTNFANCNMQNIKINCESRFLSCNFTNVDMQKSIFIFTEQDKTRGYGKIRFISCNFTNAILTGITQLDNAAFTYSDMTGAKIERKWFNYLKTQEVKNFDKIRWQ